MTKDLSEDNIRWNWKVICTLPRSLRIAFLAWSLAFVPEPVAAVLFDSWPAFYIVILHSMFSSGNVEDRDNKFNLNHRNVLLLFFIFCGMVFVVLSSSQQEGTSFIFDGRSLIGIALLIIAIGFIIQKSIFVKWADVMVKAEQSKSADGGIPNEKINYDNNETGYAMLIWGISLIVGSCLGFSLSIFSDGSLETNGFIIALLGGAIIEFLGVFFDISGTVRSKANPNLQAILYLTPVFSVLILWVFSHVTEVRGDLLTLGICATVVGNVLVYFPTEDKFGLASLVVALWTAGWIVLFRDNIFNEWFSDQEWFLQADSYFAVLALAATAFTLLLAFRISRISSRASQEEALVFSLLTRLNRIEKIYGIELVNSLELIDAPNSPDELEEQYLSTSKQVGKITN